MPAASSDGAAASSSLDHDTLLQDVNFHKLCIETLSTDDPVAVVDCLMTLGEILNATITPYQAEVLCSKLRESGSLERICGLLRNHEEHAIVAGGLMVIGNLISVEIDVNAQQTQQRVRAANGVATLAMHLLSSDREILFYACGACMNLCSTIEDVAALKEASVLPRLVQLSGQGDEIAAFAGGCIKNVQLTIAHAAAVRMHKIQLQASAAIALQARARGLVARKRCQQKLVQTSGSSSDEQAPPPKDSSSDEQAPLPKDSSSEEQAPLPKDEELASASRPSGLQKLLRQDSKYWSVGPRFYVVRSYFRAHLTKCQG